MRAFNRFKTDEMIDCAVGGKRGKVALYNLSCGGCMIESGSKLLTQGAEVALVLRERIEVSGRVAWRIGKNAGIKFEQALHPRVVEQFGYDDEEFDRHDPRDRFGIPLVEMLHAGAGRLD
ncbi:MAG: PilZ domain-containing protein [Sphingomonadaceae bacterium]|nr:PilZ domain-containing protein [Sphingomonadaceae bacterium]